jgi:type II secretory pathway pseudopilin PulG
VTKVDCERAQKLISLYLAGDIGTEDLEALMAHLASCEKCKAAFEEAKRYEAVLKGVFAETISKKRSPKSRVLRKLAEEGRPRRGPASFRNWTIFIVLMAVLCFLIVVAYVSYEKYRLDAIEKSNAARAQLAQLQAALDLYRADYGAYPLGGNESIVKELLSNRKDGNTPYFVFRPSEILEGRVVDPWKEPYVYKSTGETALLYSKGPNHRDDDGVVDDIRP